MKKRYQVLALFCLLFGVQDTLSATKSLLTDEIFPNVNDAIQTEVATAENRLTGLNLFINQLQEELKGLVQKVAGLEQKVAGLETENAQLKQRLDGLDVSYRLCY